MHHDVLCFLSFFILGCIVSQGLGDGVGGVINLLMLNWLLCPGETGGEGEKEWRWLAVS